MQKHFLPRPYGGYISEATTDEVDYETFLAKRAAKLWTMIEVRIHPFATQETPAPISDPVDIRPL